MAKKPTKDKDRDEHGLTRIERVFADALALSGNKKASAEAAGIKPNLAGVYANRMLKNVKVQTYLAARKAEVVAKLDENHGLTAERVLKELAAVALFDPAKMYDENGALLPVNRMDEMTRRAIAGVDVKELIDFDSGLVMGYNKKVRMVSKIAALELAGRHLALWGDKDGSALSILNINIVTSQNQLDHGQQGKVIENGAG